MAVEVPIPPVQSQIPVYSPAPPTDAELDYADLPIIDFSNVTSGEGRTALAEQVKNAMLNHGFFYVINHGYTREQTKRAFDIANMPFEHVSDAEKRVYTADMKGQARGRVISLASTGTSPKECTISWKLNRDITKRQHPEPIRPLLPEVQAFAKHSHFNVLHPVLRLLAIGLEIPEETFVDMHGWDAVGETYVRFMKYYPRTPEEEQKTSNIWMKGHTDFGTVTLLYSQPVAALQVMTRQGVWKWVRHIENAIVVNTGDAMEFLSGGYYCATIHRVIQPPPDQQAYTRVGVFYFALANDDVKLSPVSSPVLQRIGADNTRFMNNPAVNGGAYPTMESWRKGRTSAYGQSELVKQGEVEEELIEGVVVKHYS
ncbi:hypothetical protein D9756_009415 [Leucocoprinus leucothites]|uniref:Clavaminate synthase-like protein n=1 Tax=Leucocoprinus leucothites TaxID=201217 RepID=A0A8H5CZ54_9AGAR|nr:hypothetical protein D9756_009415 [Leucoagaricus leucothites]